jgi:hypothetical protein
LDFYPPAATFRQNGAARVCVGSPFQSKV